jgi:hypothetical protein
MRHLKTNLAIVFIALMATTLTAQDKGQNRVGGIRAGYNGAALVKDGDLYPLSEANPSFYAGFFRDNKIIPMLHFGTGLEYVQNGMRFNEDNKRVLHYVSVPLNLKFKLGPVFALGGIAPSFKLAEREFVGGNSSKPDSDDTSNWFDAPLFLGAGVKILFITVEARYHWGITDVYQGYNNRYLQIGAGISF